LNSSGRPKGERKKSAYQLLYENSEPFREKIKRNIGPGRISRALKGSSPEERGKPKKKS